MIIIGGGVAGLATGLELRRRGWPVTILERAGEVGGLARTVVHDGFRFDIGGHRFHSHNPRLLRWLQDLLGDDLLRVPRRSHIYLQGQFIPYPLQFPQALSIFSPLQLGRVLGSYVVAQARGVLAPQEAASFEEWVVRRFGRALYEIYFRPYTEKVWGIPCDRLSADWAAQRISLPSLLATVRRALWAGRRPPRTLVSEFYYPRQGFGMIPERMAEEVTRLGGEIITEATVTAVRPTGPSYVVRYERGGRTESVEGAHVVSTIPLGALLAALSGESANGSAKTTPAAFASLDYRDLICLFLAVDRPRVSRDHWTYFPQPELVFGRTHEPRNWSAALAPEGMTSLVVEIFSGRGEATWQKADETLARKAVDQLEALDFLPRGSVVEWRVLRVPNAYPLYRTGYAEELQRVRRRLQRFPRLHLVGRTGAFRYLNSDGVIEDAFALVDWMCGLSGERVNVSAEYSVP